MCIIMVRSIMAILTRGTRMGKSVIASPLPASDTLPPVGERTAAATDFRGLSHV